MANQVGFKKVGTPTLSEFEQTIIWLVGNPADNTMAHRLADKHFDASAADRLLAALGLDPVSFEGQYGVARDTFEKGIGKAYERLRKDNSGQYGTKFQGLLGLASFTLAALKYAADQARPLLAIEYDSLNDILADRTVVDYFHKIYAPLAASATMSGGGQEGQPNAAIAREHWASMNKYNLRLHRIGSTSFILQAEVAVLSGMKLALKCLLFPYTQVRPIVEATRDYAVAYPPGQVPSTAAVHSSADRWILMDFIDGPTLAEFLDERRNAERQAKPLLRIDLLRSVGKLLLEALYALDKAHKQHHDLTPSNIIVAMKPDIEDGGRQIDRVVLIDLGTNYLYTNKVGLTPSRDALFVAPEVRGEQPDAMSDLFSFGCILIDLIDPAGLVGAAAPDSAYRYAPEIARFIDDLIDADPDNRLLLFGRPDRRVDYAELLCIYADHLRLLPPGNEVGSSLKSRLREFNDLYNRPSSGQVRRHWEAFRLTRKSHHAVAQYSGYLFAWTAVCTFSWYLTFLICVDWALRDLSLDNWTLVISLIQKTAHSGANLPLIDSLRASDYRVHDWRTNLPVRIVGLCSGVAVTKYYQNILGGLTVKMIHTPLARIAEFSSRLMSFWILPPLLAANLWEPRLWPWMIALSCIPIAVNTFFCHLLAVRCLDHARPLSTVPKRTDPALEAFGHWTGTMVPYIFFLFGIAIGLRLHILHDIWLYALEVAGIHLIIHYVVKCTLYGPQVRGSLARAFAAGERAEVMYAWRAAKTGKAGG